MQAYWLKLHQVIAAAEASASAETAVSDTLRHGGTQTSALAAYAECNLLSAASPYELPARHMAWIARWARRWGAKPELLTAPPEDIRNRAVPLWVDLDAGRPPGHVPQPAGNGRWLETTELRKSLAARIALLEQGRAPAELQLGDDVTQPAAEQLLQRLLQRWCAGGANGAKSAAPPPAPVASWPASRRCTSSSAGARHSARPRATTPRCAANGRSSKPSASAATRCKPIPAGMIRRSRTGW
jgi:hypothetical protein